MKVLDFFFAARPMLHLPIWSIYLIANHAAFSQESITLQTLLILTALSLAGAGSYFLNQIFDYKSDLLNQKLGFLQKGYISKHEMIVAYLLLTSGAMAIGYFSGDMTARALIFICLLGYAYSAPPLRLKDKPVAGLLANAIGFGFLIPLAVPSEIAIFEWSTLLLPGYFFLTVGAVYLLTVIPDREGDILDGKRTMATILGNRHLIDIAVILLALSVYLAYLLNHDMLLIISVISLLLNMIALILNKQVVILLACKLPILLLSLLAGYYYPYYLVFIVVLIVVTRLYYKRRFGIIYPRIN